MINKNEFNQMKKELEKFEQKREEVIQLSRKIIKISKQCIYALHREDQKNALLHLQSMKKLIPKLPKQRFDTDIAKVALQEYVEAYAYYSFMKTGSVASKKEMKTDTESYLLGICDLSGELMRRAVKEAIKKNNEKVLSIRELLEEIYGLFLGFDFRNNELRKKSDQIKWNLSKVEDLCVKLK